MFIPVGEHSQGTSFHSRPRVSMVLMAADIWQIDKDSEGHVTEKKLFGVMVRVSVLCTHATLTIVRPLDRCAEAVEGLRMACDCVCISPKLL